MALLPGRTIRDAVRASRRNAPAESGGFLQVDDRMLVEGDLVVAIGGAPLDPDRDYRIALLREVLLGLDGVGPLAELARAEPARVPPAGSGREVKVILVEAFARELWRSLGTFDEVDSDHDERVTEPEIEAALARVTHEPPSHVAADLVLHAMDRNHDDVVSRDEAEDDEKVR